MKTHSGEDEWRNRLPVRCPHQLDSERNPDRLPNLCLTCRYEAADPYAMRVLAQRREDARWWQEHGWGPADELAARRMKP